MVVLNYYVVLDTSIKLNMHPIFIESHYTLIMISHNNFRCVGCTTLCTTVTLFPRSTFSSCMIVDISN